MAEPYFRPSLFSFLRDLKRHNNREWFAANKARYVEEVEGPMLRFIAAVGERLPSISGAYVADPRRSGGSLYRIYRDTRFSADKTPYKTHTAAHFRHRSASKTQESPGFYLHLSPSENWAGGGIYHPEMPTLTRIRQRIVAEPREWARVRKAVPEIDGDRLTRPPAGFDPSHKFVEDLKRKDFYAGPELSMKDVTSKDFLDRYVDACASIAPLMEFLTKSLGLRW